MYTPFPADQAKIHNNFTYHAPTEGQRERYVQIRAHAKAFAQFLVHQCPGSRELSLAITNLEQAVMWANAAIARNEAA